MSQDEHETNEGGIKKNITGIGQQIIGEIEIIGGVLTGDPVTRAEGEFNVETGEVREAVEDDLEPAETESETINDRSVNR
jgi:uncharacterized protein YjbJ (UPF0337 family)